MQQSAFLLLDYDDLDTFIDFNILGENFNVIPFRNPPRLTSADEAIQILALNITFC